MPAECARVGGGGRGWYRGGLPARGLSPLTHPLGGVTCCTCHGLARCVSYYGSVLPPPSPPSPVWGGLPVVLVVGWLGACPTGGGLSDVARSDGDTSPHNARDFKMIEKSAKWDVRCQYFVRFFSQVYKSGGRTVQLYQRYVSAVKREGPEPNPHTVHGTVVDFSVLWWTSITQPDEEEVTAGRTAGALGTPAECRHRLGAGVIRKVGRRIVVGLQGGNASRQVLKIG